MSGRPRSIRHLAVRCLLAGVLMALAGVPLITTTALDGDGAASAAWVAAAQNAGNSFEAGSWGTGPGAAGELLWWGDGSRGQGGAFDLVSTWTMAPESTGATTWSKVSAGADHTCAIRTGGTLWCWGRNADGQLGLGDNVSVSVPTQVTTPAKTWVDVSAGGNHTCAVTTGGEMYCWGRNSDGQLGDSSATNRNVPSSVAVITTGWVSVSAGWVHTCAMRSGNTLYCWGDKTDHGVPGNGQDAKTPVQITGTSWAAVSAGRNNSCATTTSNTMSCWGRTSTGSWLPARSRSTRRSPCPAPDGCNRRSATTTSAPGRPTGPSGATG